MLTLHHLETSRSQRVLWLLEELNVPYALHTYPRDPKTRLAPPALQPTEMILLKSPGRAALLWRRKRIAVFRSTREMGDLPTNSPFSFRLSRPRQPQVT